MLKDLPEALLFPAEVRGQDGPGLGPLRGRGPGDGRVSRLDGAAGGPAAAGGGSGGCRSGSRRAERDSAALGLKGGLEMLGEPGKRCWTD